MKRFTLILFAVALLFALSVTAFANGDITITYSITCDGEDDIVVSTGDTITVDYSISADQSATISTIQNEIYYDDSFFEIDESSITATYSDYSTANNQRLSGKWYVYFVTATTRTHQAEQLIGSFDLKVIATSGESTVSNTNNQAFALGTIAFGSASENLHVSIDEVQPQTFTIEFQDKSGNVTSTQEVSVGDTITLPDMEDDGNYTFNYWTIGGSSTTYQPGDTYVVTSDVTFYSSWSYSSSGSSSSTTYYSITSSAGDGGSISPSGTAKVARNNSKTYTITPSSGYIISDVLVDDVSVGAVSSYKFTTVTTDHTIEALFEASDAAVDTIPVADPNVTGVATMLETGDHIKYMNGFTDGRFGPDEQMTRAEAAQMFYNLLLDKDIEITVTFSDVSESDWYSDAVYTLASLGILQGVGEGTYAPDLSITRSEFATIAMRFA